MNADKGKTFARESREKTRIKNDAFIRVVRVIRGQNRLLLSTARVFGPGVIEKLADLTSFRGIIPPNHPSGLYE